MQTPINDKVPLCLNCKHIGYSAYCVEPLCKRLPEVHVVTGVTQYQTCYFQRYDKLGLCELSGKYWEPIPEKNREL